MTPPAPAPQKPKLLVERQTDDYGDTLFTLNIATHDYFTLGKIAAIFDAELAFRPGEY